MLNHKKTTINKETLPQLRCIGPGSGQVRVRFGPFHMEHVLLQLQLRIASQDKNALARALKSSLSFVSKLCLCVCSCVCVACGMSLWQSTLHLYDNEHVKIAQNQSLRTKNHCKLLRMPLPQQQQQLCVLLSLRCVCPTVPATVPVPEIYSCLLLCQRFMYSPTTVTNCLCLCLRPNEGQFRVMMKYDPNGLKNCTN